MYLQLLFELKEIPFEKASIMFTQSKRDSVKMKMCQIKMAFNFTHIGAFHVLYHYHFSIRVFVWLFFFISFSCDFFYTGERNLISSRAEIGLAFRFYIKWFNIWSSDIDTVMTSTRKMQIISKSDISLSFYELRKLCIKAKTKITTVNKNTSIANRWKTT